MLTAALSFAGGLLNAFLPDVVGYFKKRQEMAERAAERAHEKDLLLTQADIQVKLGQQRLEEQNGLAVIELVKAEMSAFAEQMKAIYKAQEPIGIRWVDAWNASLRPFACTSIIIMLNVVAYMYVWDALQQYVKDGLELREAADLIWKSLVGEAIQAVLGYLFGYRGGQGAKALAARVAQK